MGVGGIDDGLDHEVRAVADVGQRAEEDGAEGDGFQQGLALEVDGCGGAGTGGVDDVERGLDELADSIGGHGDVERAEGDLQEGDVGRRVVENGGEGSCEEIVLRWGFQAE